MNKAILKITQRPNWKRYDNELYQETIRKSVAEKDTENLKNAAHEIEHLTKLLHDAGKSLCQIIAKTYQ